MRRIIFGLTMLLMFGLTSTVSAEIQTYEGVGICYMADSDRIEICRLRSKKIAERDVLEQIGVYVTSESEVRNFRLTEDEIVTIAAGIMKVTEIRYKLETDDETAALRVECRLKAMVDSDEIPVLLERERQARLGR